jgi:two-component system sensor histidine kinase BarA
MPIMDGYECSKKLKILWNTHPKMRSKIVACTAGTHATEKQKAFQAGMDDFLEKPISKIRVKQILDNF